ncbi:MAG: fused response regulator/phosphatase [Clostridiales bacterium]|jgi:sigma-B regulation protein RsbU (phosphoserine phosphatase)|nr:fused response regulator/phosphatase [Clostridiales bacterium]
MAKIIVADNNPKSTELISQYLTQKEYEVITAENGRQVLAKAQLFSPDLIIMDTAFSDQSGYDICRKIKGNPNTKYALVLFICSYETKDTVIKALQAGADDIMEKSFNALVLSAKVASLLRISNLRNELEQKYSELEEKNKMMDFQLKMSRQIQRGIMRDYDLNINGAHIITHYLPALEIGGDFYDVKLLNDTTLGLCIGDVSGHGISAALLTTMLSTMIKNTYSNFYEPDKLLSLINKQFCETFENSVVSEYATLFCAEIDTKNKRIVYSNAGQTYPFYLINKNSEVIELAPPPAQENPGGAAQTNVNTAGTPIGMMYDSVYEKTVIEYEKNDLILLFTDGLSDNLFKESSEEFTNKMRDLLLDAQPIADLSVIKQLIIETFCVQNVSASKKYAMDDVSIVLCRFED